MPAVAPRARSGRRLGKRPGLQMRNALRSLGVSRVGAALSLALVGIAALPAVTASGALFTDQISPTGNTASAATLDAVSTLTATRSGTPAGTQSHVAWSSANSLEWATKNNITAPVDYTVKRSLSETNFDDAITVKTGPETSFTDRGDLPAMRTSTIAVGFAHSCALTKDGDAYCWGYNANGQLGTKNNPVSSSPDLLSSTVPVPVTKTGVLAGKKLVSLTAGDAFTCALDSSGIAYCWGANGVYQLGSGSGAANSVDPVLVSGGKRFSMISAGDSFVCGLDTNGAAYCWGYGLGAVGQAGATANLNTATAVKTTGLSGRVFSDIESGPSHACMIQKDGKEMYCWGRNTSGELGQGNTTATTAVVAVPMTGALNGKSLVSSTLGGNSTCVVETLGGIYCWGGNSVGQAGQGTVGGNILAPTLVPGTGAGTALQFNDVDTYGATVCATTTASTLYCWGNNNYGQLGLSNTTNLSTPTRVITTGDLKNKEMSAISIGSNHVCATDDDGAAYCWGANGYGQLGVGTTVSTSTVPVSLTPHFTQVSAGRFVTCAVSAAGAGYCWGDNTYATVGNGASGGSISTPSVLPTLTGGLAGQRLASIAVGERQACALTAAGKVFCWGSQNYGEIGVNSLTGARLVPTQITDSAAIAGKVISQITAGSTNVCALDTAGAAYCWGRGDHGTVGNNATGHVLTAQAVTMPAGAGGFSKVSLGGYSACGIGLATKFLYCWGYNDLYGLGVGDNVRKIRPTAQSPARPTIDVTFGSEHGCSIGTDTNTYCWGVNSLGQLGRGNYSAATTIVVQPSAVKFTQLSTTGSANTTCGITTQKVAYCWGSGGSGQIGDGAQTTAPAPTAVRDGIAFDRITTADQVTCGIVSASGDMKCWGVNGGNGRFGVGTTTSSITPVDAAITTAPAVPAPVSTCYSPQAVTPATGLCSLEPGTAYYYQVGYKYNAWTSAMKTTARPAS
jgi:alpha-tubulin suppressor-like RCC1 family protein